MFKQLLTIRSFIALVSATLLTLSQPLYADSHSSLKSKAINGTQIEYLDVGKGEPVLFVHGAIGDYRTWGSYLKPIAKEHRFIAYSQRYFGEQAWADKGEKFRMDVFADDLAAFIKSLDVGPVHMVTWSYGGMMSTAVAIKHPELVKSMVHFEPAGGSSGAIFVAEDEAKVKPARDAFFSTFGGVAKQLKAGNAQQAARALTETVFEMQPGDFETKIDPAVQKMILANGRTVPLQMTPSSKDDFQYSCENVAKVKAPVLIVKGELTNAYWTQISEKSAQCMPNAVLATIKGVNHNGPAAKPEIFTQLITEFVGKNQ